MVNLSLDTFMRKVLLKRECTTFLRYPNLVKYLSAYYKKLRQMKLICNWHWIDSEITSMKAFNCSNAFTSPCLGTRITSVCSSTSTSTSSLTFVPFSTTFKAYFSTCNKRTKIENKCQRKQKIEYLLSFLIYSSKRRRSHPLEKMDKHL